MSYRFSSSPVLRVSSLATTSTPRSVSSARSVMSSMFPIGVPTRYSTARSHQAISVGQSQCTTSRELPRAATRCYTARRVSPCSQEGHRMIDFTLTDEQQAMQQLAHTFADEEIRPVAAELDEHEEFPWELVKKAGELGLTTFAFPEELGGLGITDELTNCLITEELSWGCAGVATVLGGTHLASIPILLAGSDEQKQRLLKPIVERNGLCAMALTEQGAGSDVAAMSTTARRAGGGWWLPSRWASRAPPTSTPATTPRSAYSSASLSPPIRASSSC